jgi:ADP-ribose pyrophosphatase YjhB (NUDIX family)
MNRLPAPAPFAQTRGSAPTGTLTGVAAELAAIAQTGLTYCTDSHDAERYQRLLSLAAELNPDSPTDRLLAQVPGHATPRTIVRGAAFDGDSVLLIKEQAAGRWSLPGGWAEPKEKPSEAIGREFEEETGHRVRVRSLAAVWDGVAHNGHAPGWNLWKLYFLVDLTDDPPAAVTDPDTLAVAFHPVTDLPPMSNPRTTAAQITALYEHYRNPDQPAAFD